MLRTTEIDGDLWLARDSHVDPDDATIPTFTRHPIPSKTGGQFGAMLPDTVVLHFTGGDTAEGAIAHWEKLDVASSAHFVIDRNGSVTQCVPLNRIAWHAGESSHRAWTGEIRNGLNEFSLGIELVNPGELVGESGYFRTWWGKAWQEGQHYLRHKNRATESWWAIYPDAQLLALNTLVETLARVLTEARGHIGLEEIIGHDDIASGRKWDPGPSLNMFPVRQAMMRGRLGASEIRQPPKTAAGSLSGLQEQYRAARGALDSTGLDTPGNASKGAPGRLRRFSDAITARSPLRWARKLWKRHRGR